MKRRLDEVVVERGLAANLAGARALIMAGQVSGAGMRLDKPGLLVVPEAELHVKDQPRYVSRAGEKLASVSEKLGLDFDGRVVLDVGSSTGGFTDFALQHGASRVYCVDVGTAQLAYKLRQDPRVVVMEQTDVRDAQLPERPDMAVIDVSFIALNKIMAAVAALVRPDGLIVAMVKPQFEADRLTATEHKGVIPMGPVRDEIIAGVRDALAADFEIIAEADSGLPGSEGNVEHFMLLKHRRGV